MRLTTYSKSAEEAATYRRGWSRIWGSLKGGIYLVPSETAKIVVQTLPDIKISCVLAAKKRRLEVSFDKEKILEVEVNTPDLLLQQVLLQVPYHCEEITCKECKGHDLICFCESCQRFKRQHFIDDPITPYYLYELMAEKKYNGNNIFYIRPYRIGNVDPDGKICIGRQTPTPTLRQANFNFWNSSFNNDYPDVYQEGWYWLDGGCNLNEVFAKKFQNYAATTTVYNGVSTVCGTQFMASSKHTDGVFISYDDRVISEIPLAARSQTKKGVAAIGLALLTKYGEWRIDFKAGYSTTFTDREVYLV